MDGRGDDADAMKREKAVADMASEMFRDGHDDLAVYRALGLSTSDHWDWLQDIKKSSCRSEKGSSDAEKQRDGVATP